MKTENIQWSFSVTTDVPLLTSRGSNGQAAAPAAPAAAEIKATSGTEASLEKQVIGFFKLKETSDWMIIGLCSIIDFQTSELKHNEKCLAHTVYVTPISADSSVRKCSF